MTFNLNIIFRLEEIATLRKSFVLYVLIFTAVYFLKMYALTRLLYDCFVHCRVQKRENGWLLHLRGEER